MKTHARNAIFLATLATYAYTASVLAQPGNCDDGNDNDGDGWTDGADPDCIDSDNETGYNQDYTCNDNRDNDGDGLIDADDKTNCSSATSEESGDCTDGRDNDQDGWADADDPDCFTVCDSCAVSEVGLNSDYACNDGLDNDGDGSTDASDPDCNSGTDQDESSPSCSASLGRTVPASSSVVLLLPLIALARRRFPK